MFEGAKACRRLYQKFWASVLNLMSVKEGLRYSNQHLMYMIQIWYADQQPEFLFVSLGFVSLVYGNSLM